MERSDFVLNLFAFSLLTFFVAAEEPQLTSAQRKIQETCDYFCEHGGAETKGRIEGRQCRCFYDDCNSEGILYLYKDIIGVNPKAIQDAKRKVCPLDNDGDKNNLPSESEPMNQPQTDPQQQEPHHHHHDQQKEQETLEQEKREQVKREQEKREQEKREQEKREQEKREQEKREQEKREHQKREHQEREQEKREHQKREHQKREQEKREQEKREQEKREQEKREQEKREQEKREQEKREQEKREQEKREQEKREQEKREREKQEQQQWRDKLKQRRQELPQQKTTQQTNENKQEKFEQLCDYFCEKGGAISSQMILTGMKCKCTYKECIFPIDYSHTFFSAVSPKDIQDKEKLTKCVMRHKESQQTQSQPQTQLNSHSNSGKKHEHHLLQQQQHVPTKLTDLNTCTHLCKNNGFSSSQNDFSLERKVCTCYSSHDRHTFQAYNQDALPIELVKPSKHKSLTIYKNIYDGVETIQKKIIIMSDSSCSSHCKSPPSVINYKWTHAKAFSYSYYAASIGTCHCYNSKENYCDYDENGDRIRMRDE